MYSSFTPNNPGGRATTVAGIDEAGRGPLAGAVVAAAVVLTPGQVLPGVRDSKQLSAARREALRGGATRGLRSGGKGALTLIP